MEASLSIRNSCIMLLLLAGLVFQFSGCTNYNRSRGVENTWRQVDLSGIEPGRTTQKEVLDQIGPPSQIINLAEGSVFYYLAEQTEGGGVILILFNSLNEKTIYDRAVFFFDDQGILSEYALSKESIE